ncbi:MAG TPA: cold shock domain-containing protein [Acidimicrobiales bacterium]|jgi:cold shock CspA family protein|nr:cold shock domain-containing protein [Acidimicrobiales bacterium]
MAARGRVVEFDEHVGTGVVAGEDGRRLFFHCVAIADGSRRIDVGTPVTYEVVPGHLGRYEAQDLRPNG